MAGHRMLNRPAYSVVVTARNEAHTLPLLCQSLAPFLSAGGELLVVDTGSDDGTVRVARELGARVEAVGSQFHSTLTSEDAAAIERRFARRGDAPLVRAGQTLFNFGDAREFAGQRASNRFVWHLDASDVVESADFDLLDTEIRSGWVESFDYSLVTGRSRCRIARFFDRRVYRWRGRVHELPERTRASTTAVRFGCTDTQLSVRHTYHDKTRNYVAGLALDVLAHPRTPRWRYYLGRELHLSGRHRSAIPILQRHAAARNTPAVERGESLRVAGACLEAAGRLDKAAASYARAFEADPSRRQALVDLARLRQSRGDFEGSVAAAASALEAPRGSENFIPDESRDADSHAMLYWGLFWLGKREEARVHWELCRQLEPEDAKYRDDARLFQASSE